MDIFLRRVRARAAWDTAYGAWEDAGKRLVQASRELQEAVEAGRDEPGCEVKTEGDNAFPTVYDRDGRQLVTFEAGFFEKIREAILRKAWDE